MNTVNLYNMDNMLFETGDRFDVIYCDYIYENSDFSWAEKYFQYLKWNGIFIAQTDWHTNHRYRVFMEDVCGAFLVNDAVVKAEWGNHPKNKFHQCFDNIIIYSNGKNWVFHPEKIQVPKATMTKGLNPSGRETKQATAWIDDCTLTTTSLERVRKDDGHLIRWQKPLKLYDRIIAPFVDEEHKDCLDPFAGSGSFGKWCKKNDMNYTGIEYDPEVYGYAKKNIYG
jgi:DNA modification methylase